MTKLEPHTDYYIVPSTFHAGEESEYFLTINAAVTVTTAGGNQRSPRHHIPPQLLPQNIIERVAVDIFISQV